MLALAGFSHFGDLSVPAGVSAKEYRINSDNLTTLFAPRASPTFTGLTTAATLNAATLQIGGVSTDTLYMSRPWVQCVYNGSNMTIQSNSDVGRVTPTITRTAGQAVGVYDISFTTHPRGFNYTTSAQARTDTGLAFAVVSHQQANSLKVRTYNSSQALTDIQFTLIIFA